jgi:glycosyltransferase involved in cell wall biosynthesis
MLDRKLKWSALAASDIFVLPSHSEGFSVAVLEAAAAGLPVLITRGCNFPEIGASQSGLIVEPTVAQIEHGLTDMLRLSSHLRSEMGERGRKLVQREYSWERIGTQMQEVSDWVLGGSQPTGVEILTK